MLHQTKPVETLPAAGLSRLALSPLLSLIPGLALAGGIAAAAMGFRALTGIQALSPLILSIVIGMLIGNLRRPPVACRPGIGFSMKRLLRLGIILLGLQITLSQLLSLGLSGLAVVIVTLAATFTAVTLVGRLLGVDRRLTGLIAAGTSVCGASAVIAANAVVRGRDEDVTYAVACVTIFGSFSMLLFPLLMLPLHLDAVAYGLWSGATIHEVAQVVAATFQAGDVAGQYGTIAKLARVVLLAPLVLTLALTLFRSGGTGTVKAGAAPFPWFVIGFLAMVGLNSSVTLPPALSQDAGLLGTFLLSCGLAAMGLQTHMKQLAAEGFRPLALGAFGWLFISGFGYLMVRLAGF
ncbi:YeiH family protein [Rhizobium sp. SL86]|uniref:YeiH family protein n=1 Tax=Rhizobium sp. SL86 TaxID=2995148 RepID=UPI002272B529|nr:putative sulfate exporter family transporter [Rhizobium sp. SL86]MCY1668032.1 putative sulfate exporter family transporter [Rhizobium sp. SL86]